MSTFDTLGSLLETSEDEDCTILDENDEIIRQVPSRLTMMQVII